VLASSVHELQTRADNLQDALTTSRAKVEELTCIRREIEIVLVEQEKQVTTYEEQIKQMMTERNGELESASRRDAEAQQVIGLLREQCQRQQKKVDVLDGLVQQLRDELEQEKCAAVSRDSSSRSGIQDRDDMIAKLKALVRENQLTADRLKDELRRMNEEAKEKNRTIARLRRSCEQLNARCLELETALCRTSLDTSHPQHSSEKLGDISTGRQSSGNVGGVSLDLPIESMRHAQDYDAENVDTWRQRHMSATLVSAPVEGSISESDASRFLSQHPVSEDSFRQSNMDVLAGGDGTAAANQSEHSMADTRQQLLRQVCCFCV